MSEMREAAKLLAGRGRKRGGGCLHRPERLWSWYARDDRAKTGQVLCVACCDCGAVLLPLSKPKPPEKGDGDGSGE